MAASSAARQRTTMSLSKESTFIAEYVAGQVSEAGCMPDLAEELLVVEERAEFLGGENRGRALQDWGRRPVAMPLAISGMSCGLRLLLRLERGPALRHTMDPI